MMRCMRALLNLTSSILLQRAAMDLSRKNLWARARKSELWFGRCHKMRARNFSAHSVCQHNNSMSKNLKAFVNSNAAEFGRFLIDTNPITKENWEEHFDASLKQSISIDVEDNKLSCAIRFCCTDVPENYQSFAQSAFAWLTVLNAASLFSKELGKDFFSVPELNQLLVEAEDQFSRALQAFWDSFDPTYPEDEIKLFHKLRRRLDVRMVLPETYTIQENLSSRIGSDDVRFRLLLIEWVIMLVHNQQFTRGCFAQADATLRLIQLRRPETHQQVKTLQEVYLKHPKPLTGFYSSVLAAFMLDTFVKDMSLQRYTLTSIGFKDFYLTALNEFQKLATAWDHADSE